jgi:hypothetical protein
MNEFIARHRDKITGTLSGFDRLVLRGTLRALTYPDAMRRYLYANDVLLKDFGAHVKQVSGKLKEASERNARQLGRPVEYLTSSKVSKEDIARKIVDKDGVVDGLVCVLSCVEPCQTFEIYGNREAKKLELIGRQRKCVFIYHYWIDPKFGFMNARIQTWFPFSIQICLNGREWLARQMDGKGIKYAAADNCFPWIEDWAKAQRLMDQQRRTEWPKVLNPIARQLNPVHGEIFARYPVSYYWSVYQSEWAIDVVFRKAAELQRLYPRLVHHGITTFGSTDVMRYLGKRTCLNGQVPANFRGQVMSNLKEREEGIRIKHFVNGNSVKLYDKAFTAAGSVLRAETTIQNVRDFRVYRAKEGDPDGPNSWRVMRRGVADIHRREEVSEKATKRYLNGYSTVDDDTILEEVITRLQKHTTWDGHRVRALRPFADDRPLLAAVSRGEFTINGFRNRDLQVLLFSSAAKTPRETRRRSAWITRQLRLLRAHGLIKKIAGTHRYQLTAAGRKANVAILTALRCTVAQLTKLAA